MLWSLMVKEVSFVLWERRTFCHCACDHKGNYMKIIFSQVPQRNICVPQRGKEFTNAKFFQAHQMHLKTNILAQGTPVGWMTRRGMARGHYPWSMIRKPQTTGLLWGYWSGSEKGMNHASMISSSSSGK